MTLQEYRQKVEETVIKWGEGIMSEADVRDCTNELVSLYEETPGIPANDESMAFPGKSMQEKPEPIKSVSEGVLSKEEVETPLIGYRVSNTSDTGENLTRPSVDVEKIKKEFKKWWRKDENVLDKIGIDVDPQKVWNFFLPYLQSTQGRGEDGKEIKK